MFHVANMTQKDTSVNIVAGLVPIDDINRYWPEIKEDIQRACDYSGNRSSATTYHDFLQKGSKQLWLVKRDDKITGIVVTELVQFPLLVGCRINICTGKHISEWGHLYTMIEDFARANGCKQMFLIARPGMEKIVKGYRKTHVLLEKEL